MQPPRRRQPRGRRRRLTSRHISATSTVLLLLLLVILPLVAVDAFLLRPPLAPSPARIPEALRLRLPRLRASSESSSPPFEPNRMPETLM